MKNLAGKNADNEVKEELYFAGIEACIDDSVNGEVKTKIVGVLGNWKLERAWNYWIASCERKKLGFDFNSAIKLFNTINPITKDKIGFEVRVGGHCGQLSPEEYGCYPVFDEKFKDECNKIGKNMDELSYKEISELYKNGMLKSERYADCYHIDSLVGLKVFANFIREQDSCL